jgi:hypothetical protein
MVIVVNASSTNDVKEYSFLSIDKAEYSSLFDYLNSKEISIKNPQVFFLFLFFFYLFTCYYHLFFFENRK